MDKKGKCARTGSFCSDLRICSSDNEERSGEGPHCSHGTKRGRDKSMGGNTVRNTICASDSMNLGPEFDRNGSQRRVWLRCTSCCTRWKSDTTKPQTDTERVTNTPQSSPAVIRCSSHVSPNVPAALLVILANSVASTFAQTSGKSR